MQYHATPCNSMQYHAISCKTMRYHAIPCNIMQYHAIPCNTMQYHAIPCNTMQYHAIPCTIMQYHAIQCNTMQYYAIQCNTMQYHASVITADGAYHCPVGSIIAIFYLFFYQITGLWPGKHTLPDNFRESNTKRVPFGRASFFVFYSPWRERLLCINIHNSVTVTYLFFHYLEAKGKPLKPQMLALFMNQLSSYQRHQEVQYAVQHLWQRVKYDVTRLPPPGFLGSGARGPASVQVRKWWCGERVGCGTLCVTRSHGPCDTTDDRRMTR